MLRLKRISELLKISADHIEGQNKAAATGKTTDEAVKMIKELRDTARDILTSQEYQNSRIKF
jgi:negative regulator of replication initiation